MEWMTWALRALGVTTVGMHLIGALDLDAAVAAVWQWYLQQALSRWTMLEAMVAASAFAVWIAWFTILYVLAPLRRFRFVPVADKRIINFSLSSSRRLRIALSPVVYLAGIGVLHLVKVPPSIEEAPPSMLRLVGEVALGIWAYDFLFYWIHLLWHMTPSAPHGHMTHHAMLKDDEGRCFITAPAVVNHSLLDGAAQVAMNIVVQNLPLLAVPKHKLSRLVHNVLVTYLLTEAHSGLDLPWATHRVCPWLFGGAVRHEVHHHLHKCCFHQFFRYLDDWLGFGPPADVLERFLRPKQ